MVTNDRPPVRVRKNVEPVKIVPVTTDPKNDVRVRFAFVKFVEESSDVDPAATAAALVPKTSPDKSVPLTSTPGPNMRPAYNT